MQGLILTQCNDLGALLGAMRAHAIPLLKVVTSWGWPWDAHSRAQAASMASIIVRTRSGDGTATPGQMVYLDPPAVLSEIEPWVVTRGRIIVELGNEPNAGDPSDDSAWVWRYWFLETMAQIRARYGGVRIISPGLIENRQAEWWAINQDAFAQADGIGFHAYGWHDFTATDTGQIQRALAQLGQYFRDRAWFATELGINDMATSPETKASRYSTLHSKLPSNVAAALWYHFCDQPLDNDQRAYALPISAFDNLKAGGSV